MFNRLKKTLDDALRKLEDAFGAGPEDDIEDLLRAMRSELIHTKARIPEIEDKKAEDLTEDERKAVGAAARRAVEEEMPAPAVADDR